MAVTYFGYCDSETGVGTGSGSLTTGSEMDWVVAGYACPGTGAQTLKTMGVQCVVAGNYVRMGIYDGSTLVVQATSRKAALGGNYAANTWTSWDDTELTWSVGTTLTGGTTYKLAVACAANPGIYGTGSQASGTSKYASGDVTSTGMTDPLPAGSNYTQLLNIRAGVEAGGGAATNVVCMVI